MEGALGVSRGNKLALEPSAEVFIRHRQNLIAIDVLDEEDFVDFDLCIAEEALTDSTGLHSLEPVPKSTEGGAESFFL